MRFGLALCLTFAIGLTANAAPWDSVPVSTPSSETVQSPQLSMQRGGTSDKLRTLEGLALSEFATSLGTISALAVSDTGTLYAADYKTGRIWVLTDRGGDGTLDMRRPMARAFNHPTGLAVIGETLYVADAQAIWVLHPETEPHILAPLSNINSQGRFPLIKDETANTASLLMGITQSEGITQSGAIIVRVDTVSGQAVKIADIPETPLHSLSKRKGAPLWVGAGNALRAIDSPETGFSFSQQNIAAIALPGQHQAPANWPPALKEAIIASQTGPKAMQLIAIPTEFGQPSGAPRVLVEGFLSGSGRSAWGEPGPIVMDKRGLFFADTHNGTIWRLSAKPKIDTPKVIITKTNDDKKLADAKPEKSPLLIGSGITGSQIGVASQLGSASQLETGSTIIDAYEKAQKEAEEEAEALAAKKQD